MVKRFILSLVLVLTTISAISLSTFQPVYADVSFSSRCEYFLGLTSWDCGVSISDQNSLKSGIWTIAVNILTDITIVASYLVLGYTIYGGYLYIMSSGDPSKVAEGKKTLTHAFIGLAIVLLANTILNAIRIALMGSSGSFAKNCAKTQCVDASTMVANVIQWTIGIAGVVSVVFVVYGAIAYITSSGNPDKLQRAKKSITYALIGLAIIIQFVTNTIKDSNTSQVNQTIVSKEIAK